jgi:hypothetical protein
VPDQDRSIRFSGHLVFFFSSSSSLSEAISRPRLHPSHRSAVHQQAEEKAFDHCFLDPLAEEFAFAKRTRGAAGGSPSSDILFLSKEIEIFFTKKTRKKTQKNEKS